MQSLTKAITAAIIPTILFCYCGESQEKSEIRNVTKAEEELVKAIVTNRHPLPYAPAVEKKLSELKNRITEEDLLHELLKERTSLFLKMNALGRTDTLPPIKKQQYNIILKQTFILDEAIAKTVATQCGPKNDCQDVELYDGTLGVSKEFVTKYSPQIGRLKWKDNLDTQLPPLGINPGNVSDTSWGTGALINKEYFITAGHCFDTVVKGWNLPSKNGATLSSYSLAKLMEVTFNYQINKKSKTIEMTETFEVDELMEYKCGDFDYAIIKLKKGKKDYPGNIYGCLKISPQQPSINESICVIQHPNGSPKKIEAGPLRKIEGSLLGYLDIDTYDFSSGSPVLSENKNALVGVHFNGGCGLPSIYNEATSIIYIKSVSSILRSLPK